MSQTQNSLEDTLLAFMQANKPVAVRNFAAAPKPKMIGNGELSVGRVAFEVTDEQIISAFRALGGVEDPYRRGLITEIAERCGGKVGRDRIHGVLQRAGLRAKRTAK